jgi:NSS family neurotransmitter:Na+ symporter
VVFAALTSAISLLEPSVSWLTQRFNIARSKAAWSLGAVIWLLGIGTVLSFNVWQDVHFLGARTFFESLDFMTTNIMLPMGGLFMVVFVAWVFNAVDRKAEIDLPDNVMRWFLWNLRWIVPVVIVWVFASNLVTGSLVYWVMTGALLLYAVYIVRSLKLVRSLKKPRK